MSALIRIARRALVAVALFGALASTSTAQLGGPALPDVDWVQRLGNELPLDARVVRSDGTEVALGDVLERPAILALVYYECPMLCNLVLDGLLKAMRTVALDPGDDFDLIVLSIDPGETPELARANRERALARYDREGAERGFHFLVAKEDAIASIADAVGFQFTYVPETDEYAHAAGVTVVTEDGEVSRVFFGTEFAPRDLKFGLIDASGGGIGTPIDKFILRCFHYDPARGKYGFAIMTVIRVAGTITVVLIALAIVRTIRRDRRAARTPIESGAVS